jgi:hypothetical protein
MAVNHDCAKADWSWKRAGGQCLAGSIQSARLSVQSSELVLPPHPQASVAPRFGSKG